MEAMEWCWSLVYYVTGIIRLLVEGCIFSIFVRPFLNKLRSAEIVGSIYSIVMIVLYLLPIEFDYPRIIASGAVFLLMWLIDRRNMAPKACACNYYVFIELDCTWTCFASKRYGVCCFTR